MKKLQICWECGKEKKRCRAVAVHLDGEVEYICPLCWNMLELDKYLYEDRMLKERRPREG